MKDSKVELIKYNSEWHQSFEILSEKLSSLLKEHVISIDHIGSTSIPGMEAKDVIDIQISIFDFSRINAIQELMNKAGFTHLPNIKQDHIPFKDLDAFETGWEKHFFKSEAPQRCNAHIRVFGSKNWVFALLFRDYLRSYHEAAQAYLQAKRRLIHFFCNLEAYSLIKDPVCDLIYLLARKWANETGWSPCVEKFDRPKELVSEFISFLKPLRLGLKRKTVSLDDYNPGWETGFKWVSEKIRQALSKMSGFEIHHVGSTSVKGLCAKPILDVLLVFDSSEKQLAAIDSLIRLGFLHKGDAVARLEGCDPDPKRHFYSYYDNQMEVDFIHLHTYVVGHSDVSKLLVFRDKLRKDDMARNRYANLKMSLYNSSQNRREYSRSKKSFVYEVIFGSKRS